MWSGHVWVKGDVIDGNFQKKWTEETDFKAVVKRPGSLKAVISSTL